MGLGGRAAAGPRDLWSEGVDSMPCFPGGSTLLPCLPSSLEPHPSGQPCTHRGTPPHPASMAPPPPSPGAHTTDMVAVVSGPQRCRLESGHPVLCGCSSRWGWGTGSPANRHMQRPPSLHFYTQTHTHTCVHTRMGIQTGGQPDGPSRLAALRPQAQELCTHLKQGPLGEESGAEEAATGSLPGA